MACSEEGDLEKIQDSSIVSDIHLSSISSQINRWETELAYYLGLKRQDITVIQYNNSHDYVAQKLQCLMEWKKLRGDEATYGSLLKAVGECDENEACLFINRLLSKCPLT